MWACLLCWGLPSCHKPCRGRVWGIGAAQEMGAAVTMAAVRALLQRDQRHLPQSFWTFAQGPPHPSAATCPLSAQESRCCSVSGPQGMKECCLCLWIRQGTEKGSNLPKVTQRRREDQGLNAGCTSPSAGGGGTQTLPSGVSFPRSEPLACPLPPSQSHKGRLTLARAS